MLKERAENLAIERAKKECQLKHKFENTKDFKVLSSRQQDNGLFVVVGFTLRNNEHQTMNILIN